MTMPPRSCAGDEFRRSPQQLTRGSSGLAIPAVIRRALALDDRRDRAFATMAGFVLASVDVQFLLEPAALAITAVIIAQRGTARPDRLPQHRTDRLRQFFVAMRGDASCRPLRVDTGAKQGLARVDVADADHDRRIHDELFHGDATSP